MERTAETVAERFRQALDLFDLAERVMRQNLRRKHPGASDTEIEERLREWLWRRPGAEYGDGEGRPRSWPRDRG